MVTRVYFILPAEHRSTIHFSSSHAVLLAPFNLTCVMENVINVQDRIEFWCDANLTEPVALLTQNMSDCSPVVNSAKNGSDSDDRYRAVCGGGTSTALSAGKNYTLTIATVTAHDAGWWWCRLAGANTSYRAAQLLVRSEYNKRFVANWQ